MGGVTRPLAEGIEKILSTNRELLGRTPEGRSSMDLMWSMYDTFKNHPTLQTVWDMAQEGIKARNSIKAGPTGLFNNFDELTKGINSDRSLQLMHNYKTANLNLIHNTLPQGSVKQAASRLIQQDPQHMNMPLGDIEGKLEADANKHGQIVAFGPNKINLAATLYPMLRSPGPDKTAAEAALGALAAVFKDTEKSPTGGFRSRIRADVEKWIKSQLKTYYGPQAAKSFGISKDPEFFRGPEWEKKIHSYGVTWLAPGIFVAHLADFFKLPATVPAKALWDMLSTQSPANLQAIKEASGIFFHSAHSIIHNDFLARTGQITKMTKVPEIGAVINKLFHNPGFDWLRLKQLSIFGSAGYHTAQLWARQALRGDEAAISGLRDLNLDPQKIIAAGGILSPQEMENAVFHFVNNRLFIDKPFARSKLASRNIYFRVANMFHGYITREGRLVTHELQRMMKANDYVGIAQFAATLGIVFPYANPLLHSLGTLVRTASPSQAGDVLQTDYQDLTFQHGGKAFALRYLEMLGHFGGAGAFMNFVHAAANHQAASALIGPVPSVGIDLYQDIVAPFVKPSEVTGEGDWRPLERDALRYLTIPLLGGWLANHFISKGRQTPLRRSRLRMN